MHVMHCSEQKAEPQRGTRTLTCRLLSTIFCAISVALACVHPAVAAAPVQRSFPSPGEAAQALADAIASNDDSTILAVLGPTAEPLISSGDPVADQATRERFAELYRAGHTFSAGPTGGTVLEIGSDGWPFPIPLVRSEAGWRFDAEAGREEILDRRIGANELAAIQACLAYVDAQREYYDVNPGQSALLHYAQQLASTPGKRDGLYWEPGPGEPESPLGALFASARAEGYDPGSGRGEPYHGYVFRLLTRQGSAAAGGAYDYVAHGAMIGGFGLIAYPAKWDNSGVMTFIVNHDGVVFQKDLGPDTGKLAQAITAFDPDDTWQRVDAADEAPGGTAGGTEPVPSATGTRP